MGHEPTEQYRLSAAENVRGRRSRKLSNWIAPGVMGLRVTVAGESEAHD